jgi:hypothetical protein
LPGVIYDLEYFQVKGEITEPFFVTDQYFWENIGHLSVYLGAFVVPNFSGGVDKWVLT